jgi:hypothetical protein
MIDILQIRKYDIVMEELDPNLAQDEIDDDEPSLLTIPEDEELDDDRGFSCLWDEMDSEGRDIPCKLNVIPNSDGTMPDFCPKHAEEHTKYLEVLELYIKDILKICDPILVKKMNKEQQGWKKAIEDELGLTKYMLKKVIEEKHAEGKSITEIANDLDNLED